MDDQHDDCRPSTVSVAGDGARSGAHSPPPATGPPPTDLPATDLPATDLPASLGERMELRIRVAELTAVIDTIETTLRDARGAGLKVTQRHERLSASANAAAGLLRAIARRLA
ncbi:hypothetical protein [Elioraea sp.]|uniref:hypothetical protein n=1 Tax=Elioraea sp. TaxID=2185103 RepID=UPI003F708A28